MKSRSGKAYDHTFTVPRKIKADSSKEHKNEQLPSKQQKIDQDQEIPVATSLSSSSQRSSISSDMPSTDTPYSSSEGLSPSFDKPSSSSSSSSSSASTSSSSNGPSNVPNNDVSSPISITETLASTSNTASRASQPTIRHRTETPPVDLTSQPIRPSNLPIHYRSTSTWVKLRVPSRTCTCVWYVRSDRRRALAPPSSFSLLTGLPEIPEEATSSDNESLDIIGPGQYERFEENALVYTYDSDKDRSVDITHHSHHQELK